MHHYIQKIHNIGLDVLEDYKGSKKHHKVRCQKCNHIWEKTLVSVVQTNKKHGTNGCPECAKVREQERFDITRKQNIEMLESRGFEILSDWDGRRWKTGTIPEDVTVRNTKCNHTFTSRVMNLLTREVDCPICAQEIRSAALDKSNEERHEIFKQNSTEWEYYKSEVYKLTKKNYQLDEAKINPDNLPRGLAGDPEAYHLDHIVPVRYCFDNNIPIEVCAHPDNLQIIHWKENVGSRDKIKYDIPIPTIFEGWVK